VHTSRNVYQPPARTASNRNRRHVAGLLLACAFVIWSTPTQASVMESTGGPTTTRTDTEVYFSPATGQVWTSYSDNALFSIANVSGDLAIAFNTTLDGTLVVAANSGDPSLSTVARLSSGAVVGAGDSFDNTEYNLAEYDGIIGNWNALGSGYFGFRFGTGTDVHYGWASITVLPDFNITLNSFAYETLAGKPIAIAAAAVPEPTSFALVGIFGLLGFSLCLWRSFLRRSRLESLAAGLVIISTVLSAQTSNVPGQTDPVGSRSMQFRSDHLFSTTENPSTNPSNTVLNTFGVQYSSNPFTVSLSGASNAPTSATVSGRQYHTVSGRFLQPDHDDVVIAYANGSNIDIQVLGQSSANSTLPTSILARYVATVPNGPSQPNGSSYPTVDFLAIAAGDLDHAVDSSGNYHDEVVIAYVTAQNTYDLVVLDFSGNVADPQTGSLTVVPPKVIEFQALEGLQFDASMMIQGNNSPVGHVLPYENIVSVSAGDFDGDGSAEIAVGAIPYQSSTNPDTSLAVQTLRYRPEQSQIFEIGLQSLPIPQISTPQVSGSTGTTQGYAGANLTMASGDYEGRGADDLAFGYLAYGAPTSSTSSTTTYDASHVIHLLNATAQAVSVQATVTGGKPTMLAVDSSLVGRIPQQLTISNATGSWAVLNGTWQTTLTGSQAQAQISLPVDTSGFGSYSGSLTLSLSTALGAASGNTPLQSPLPPFTNADTDDYPKLQLVSGLFKYDPANGWDFSRRQLAAVWNDPRCTTCSPVSYTIKAEWLSVSPDGQGNPQFSLGGFTGLTTQGGPEAAQFFSATTGAFRGNTILNTSPTLPPIWSLAINAWYTDSQEWVYILEPDGNGGFNSSSQTFPASQVDRQARLAVVNYDSDGSSVYLGAPIHLSISNLMTPTTIIKEPPKHLAWFKDLSTCPTVAQPASGPGICNVNRNDGFNVQFADTSGNSATTSTQEQSSSDFASSTSLSAGLSVKDTVFPGISTEVSTSDTETLSYDTTKTNSSYYSGQTSLKYSSGAETDHDDFLQVQSQNLNIWRYRVYSSSSDNSSPYAYYDLTFPSSPINNSTPGLQHDWYNPVHENGNVLSYSPLPSSQLPDDVGPPYTVNGQVPSTVKNGVLYSNQNVCVGGTSGVQTITMAGVTTSTDTVATEKKNSWDNDMKVADSVDVEGSSISTSVDADLGQKQSLSSSTASSNTTTGSTSVTLNVDSQDSTYEYGIYPVFYNSSSGVLKFMHYVSIPTAGSSETACSENTWWTDNYGTYPDPALNLPNRFYFGSFNKSADTTTWNPQTDLVREQLRGFFVTSATPNQVESTSSDPEYTPVSINPTEGSTVRLAVRVYNFSVNQNAAENVQVQFSAVPYDSNADNELACGTPSSGETGRYCAPSTRTVLGTTTVSNIPWWGSVSSNGGTNPNWTTADYSWPIPSSFIEDNQNATHFRIYVNLIYQGSEINPPQLPCNHANPSSLVCPSQIAVSPSDSNWDPNAPGQNNEGFGYITLQSGPPSTQSALRSSQFLAHSIQRSSELSMMGIAPGSPISVHNLKTSRDSLAAVDHTGHLKTGLVIAYLGRPLHIRVKAYSEGNEIQDLQKARVFDGSRARQKLIAVKALRGASSNGTSAWFHWTPTTLGLHRLTEELLEPQKDLTKGDNTAKLSVIVVRAPGDVNGDGSVDGLDTEIISEQIGKSTAKSTCGAACDLNGNGFIGQGDLDLAVAHCDHAFCAISHTIPSQKRKKQSQ
jgi:hypothetical protein